MVAIVVVRYAGDRPGDDIVDPLLSSAEAQVQRGKSELDQNATLGQTVNLSIVYRPDLHLGQLVEVHDALQGSSYRAKITGLSYRISGGALDTRVDLLRPLEV